MSDPFSARARQLQTAGYESHHAFALASLEMRIEQWPAEWGNDLRALVFGDFHPPDQRLSFDQLGIFIQPEKIEGTRARASTVLEARVSVAEKSVAGVKDAITRLNLLVGILSYANRGAPIRWWSFMMKPITAGAFCKLDDGDPASLLTLVDLLPSEPRKRVTAALYWLREPRSMLSELDRDDHLAVYAGYWNAFECLVDAAGLLVPRRSLSKSAKAEAIRVRLEQIGSPVRPGDIAALYHEVVNPTLRFRAERILRQCFGNSAEHLLKECFDDKPSHRGLYALRNEINHGIVDVDNPETAMIIEARFPELWKTVFSLLDGVLQLNLQQRQMPARP